jgi:hypothetical protein
LYHIEFGENRRHVLRRTAASSTPVIPHWWREHRSPVCIGVDISPNALQVAVALILIERQPPASVIKSELIKVLRLAHQFLALAYH